MSQQVRLKPETLRSLAFSGISGSYAAVGTGISNPSQIFYVQNLTDVIITFSMDGTNDNFILPAGGFILLDVGTNHGIDDSLSFAKGTVLYAKGAPSSGSVYLTTFYMG
jgi:hypothetical protein